MRMVCPVHKNMIYLVAVFIILESIMCSPYFDAMRHACPFNDFCTVSPLRQFNTTGGHVPCCTKCSCEADCWIWDNCCPDVVHEKPVDLKKVNCKSMHLNKQNNIFVLSNKYRVMDFCPRDYGDQQIIDQCEGKVVSTNGVSDIVAVSDVKHRIYWNKYCALCHGVTDFSSWNLKMERCPPNISLIGADFLNTVMKECILQSVPPASTNSNLMSCGNTFVKTCPESSLSNPEIIQGCHEGPYTSYMWHGYLVKLYKNVLCKLCETNMNRIDANDTLCPSNWYDNSKGGFSHSGFSVLISPTITNKLVETNQKTPCADAEIFDNVVQRCIKSFCPLFSIASTGTCVPIGTLANSIVDIKILFTPTEPVNIPGDIQYHDDKQSRNYMLLFAHMIGLKSTSCNARFFTIDLIRDHNEKVIVLFVKLSVLLNEECQFNDVADIVRNQLSRDRYTTMTINSVPVRLEGKIDFYSGKDGFDLDTFNYSLYMSETMSFWQKGTFDKEEHLDHGFYVCPYLVLDIDRYNAIITAVLGEGGNSNLKEVNRFTRLADDFYTLDDGTIAVCVDTYFKLHERNGCQSTQTGFTLMFTVVFIGLLYG